MATSTKIEVSKSGWVSGTIVDRDGTAFQPTTLTLTIYEKVTKTIINSRNASALVPATDAPVGVIGFRLLKADQALMTATNEFEEHVVRLDFTWNTGVPATADAAFGECIYTVEKAPTYVTPAP